MSTENQNAQIVRVFLKTLSTGELEQVRLLLHEQATWTVMPKNIPGSGTQTGRDVIIDDFLAPVRGMFEPGEPKLEISTVIAQGDMVAVELRGYGRMKNGKPYDNTYCWVFEIEDGLVFSIREYMDSYYISTLMSD